MNIPNTTRYLLVLATLLLSILAFSTANPLEQVGKDLCSCTPTVYEFELDKTKSCEDSNLPLTGIANLDYCVTKINSTPVTSGFPTPSEITKVIFREYNRKGDMMQKITVDATDGGRVSFTSYAADVQNIHSIDDLPGSIEVRVKAKRSFSFGFFSFNWKYTNNFLINFTNQCDPSAHTAYEGPISMGWTKLMWYNEPEPELCLVPSMDSMFSGASAFNQNLNATKSPTESPTRHCEDDPDYELNLASAYYDDLSVDPSDYLSHLKGGCELIQLLPMTVAKEICDGDEETYEMCFNSCHPRCGNINTPPTKSPSVSPSQYPTKKPTKSPSMSPSKSPSKKPTVTHSESSTHSESPTQPESPTGTFDCNLCESRPEVVGDISRLVANCLSSYSNGYTECPEYQPVKCWNTTGVHNMEHAFYNQNNFNEPLHCWDVSWVTRMDSMFKGASAFNQDLNDWDVRYVGEMDHMFYRASAFNQNLNQWDFTFVPSMDSMFSGASAFNQNLNAWDVSSVTRMSSMFKGASAFNQDLNDWDVRYIGEMNYMFYGASAFNQNLNQWDFTRVSRMDSMFSGASAFNQNLNAWDVSSVKIMSSMFEGASAFNQDLNEWNVTNVSRMDHMFYGASEFNQDLSDWDVSGVTRMDSMFEGASKFNQDLNDWDISSVIASSDEIPCGSGEDENNC